MTATTLLRALPRRAQLTHWLERIAIPTGVVLVSLVAGAMVTSPQLLRIGFAGVLAVTVIGLGTRAPRPLLYGLVVWLAALGMVRRLLSHGFSSGGPADPLLLVAPFALLILVMAANERGAFQTRTRLSTAMMALITVIGFGAVNPLQGSLVAGLTALVFFLPLCAFWVGRGFAEDSTLRRMMLVYAICAVPAAAYGLLQISNGFPSWDQEWIERSGYAALQVGDAVRPFSSFSSASEYAVFLSIAILAWGILARRFARPVSIAAIALLSASVFYQSSRGSVVSLLAAVALIVAAKRRLSLGMAITLAVGILALLPLVAGRFAPATYGTDAKSQLIQHQLEGLANPFDAESSTASAHMSLIVGGIKEGFRQPLGHGISTITIAGKKFGGSLVGGTEADASNAAVAMGLPGLLAFLAVFWIGFGQAYRLARRTQSPMALLALGVLTVTANQWLNGGRYAVAFLPWLLLGFVDRRTEDLDASERAEAAP